MTLAVKGLMMMMMMMMSPSERPTCPHTYVSAYQYVPNRKTNVSPYLCVPIPVCPHAYVSPYLYVPVPICPQQKD